MICACTQTPVWHTICSSFRPCHMQPQRGGRNWRKLRLWQFSPILVEAHDAMGVSEPSLTCAGGWKGEAWAGVGLHLRLLKSSPDVSTAFG